MIVDAMVLVWQQWQFDFVMAYTQDQIECDMCMRLPAGIEDKDGTAETHLLKLIKNLYG